VEARRGRVTTGARQLRVLLWLTLQDVLREGVDPATGARVTPIKHLVFSMGVIGLLFALGVARHPDLQSFALHLGAASLWITAFLVMPDPLDVREKKLELLRSKPVSVQVMLRARLLGLLAVTAIVVSCMVGPPLVAGVVRFRASWLLGPWLWLALVTGAFTAVLLWLAASFVLARRYGIARVRSFSQLVLVLSVVGVMGMSLLATMAGGQGLVSLPVVSWLPSSWFVGATFGSGRDALAAGALVATALLAQVRLDVDRCYDRLEDTSEAHSPLALTELGVRAGRLVLGPAASAVAELTLRVLSREEMSRARTVAPRVVQVLAAGFALWSADAMAPIAMLAGYGFFCMADGLSTASRASQPAASWILYTAPVRSRAAVLGLAWAVLVREAVLPALLLTVVTAARRPPGAAAVLLVAFLATGGALLAFLLAVSPRLPLASEQKVWPGLGGLLGLNLLGMVAAVGYAVLVVLTGLGWLGTLVSALLVAPIVVALVVCAWVAGRRAPRGDFPH
jgi:hypothetical protein